MKTSYPVLLLTVALVPLSLPAQTSSSPSAAQPAPAAAAAPTPGAADPVVGDPVNTVFSTLGRPNGVITNPDKSNLLIYERGTVLIADGKVAEMKLMPITTYNAKLAAEAAVEADRQANAARANALLQGLMADPAYSSMPTRDRMAVLAKFDREHPGSEAKKYLADLSAVYSAEQLVQSHISELQNQVNQAKSQAMMYQQQVADAQQRLAAAQQSAAMAKAQADAARAQAAEQSQSAASKSPLVSGTIQSGNSSPGSKVGPGGSVLTGSGFGTTPAANANPAAPAAPASTVGQWVVEPDGSAHFVPAQPGS
jgi:hypothetical protein